MSMCSILLHRCTPVFGIGLLLLLESGCATAPVTHVTHPAASARMTGYDHVTLVPPDIEIQQVSAGGVAEKHDEWTALVGNNLAKAITAQTGYKVITAGDVPSGPVGEECEEVYALLRALTVNHMLPVGVLNRTPPAQRKLDYQIGPIDRITDAANSDVVLFVIARDQYSTAGRKAVMALMMVAGAAAGVGIVPPMGVSVASAALVERDGTVLWFNVQATPGTDLRKSGTAGSWVKSLLAGLPVPGHAPHSSP